jgi:hypothetical protein
MRRPGKPPRVQGGMAPIRGRAVIDRPKPFGTISPSEKGFIEVRAITLEEGKTLIDVGRLKWGVEKLCNALNGMPETWNMRMLTMDEIRASAKPKGVGSKADGKIAQTVRGFDPQARHLTNWRLEALLDELERVYSDATGRGLSAWAQGRDEGKVWKPTPPFRFVKTFLDLQKIDCGGEDGLKSMLHSRRNSKAPTSS